VLPNNIGDAKTTCAFQFNIHSLRRHSTYALYALTIISFNELIDFCTSPNKTSTLPLASLWLGSTSFKNGTTSPLIMALMISFSPNSTLTNPSKHLFKCGCTLDTFVHCSLPSSIPRAGLWQRCPTLKRQSSISTWHYWTWLWQLRVGFTSIWLERGQKFVLKLEIGQFLLFKKEQRQLSQGIDGVRANVGTVVTARLHTVRAQNIPYSQPNQRDSKVNIVVRSENTRGLSKLSNSEVHIALTVQAHTVLVYYYSLCHSQFATANIFFSHLFLQKMSAITHRFGFDQM